MNTLPIGENQIYIWVIGGCVIGGILALLSVFVFWFYLRRRSKVEKATTSIPELPAPSDLYQSKNPTPLFTSSGSEDATDPPFLYVPPVNRRPSLFQSASIDVPTQVKVTSECVQPRPVLSRWHTIGSPTYLGTVQPDLYRGSDDEEPTTPPCGNGRIWFSLCYKEENEELLVTVAKAKYLPGRGLNNTPRDPFVKLYLLPDEENFQQSKVRKRTLAPKFHETFTFKIDKADVSERTLRISVYDVDKRKVRHSLGHVLVSLSKTDLKSGDLQWRDLETASQPSSLGEMQVSLTCNPFNNRIKVAVCRLKDISGIDSGEAGIYTKVQLYHGRKLLKTKKTALRHINAEREVVFDETFTFLVTGKYFDSCNVTLIPVVAGPTPLIKDEPQGKVVIGPFMYSRGEQLLHWQDMLANPRNVVTKWHYLESIT